MAGEDLAGEVDGLSVLVTGGGTGIGAGIASRLAHNGAWVTICGRTQETLQLTADTINKKVGRDAVRWQVADVTKEFDVMNLIAESISWRDGLAGLVANAGGGGALAPIHLQDVEEYQRVLTLNVVGTLLLVKHSVPAFARAGGGSFVAISSLAGHITHPYFGAYPVSKAAVEELVRNAADEYGEANIRFNAIRPGLTMTETMSFLTEDSPIYQSYHQNTPLGGPSDVDDIGQIVSFLISPRANRITGQLINVDGGQSLRRGPAWSTMIEPAIGGRAVALGQVDPVT